MICHNLGHSNVHSIYIRKVSFFVPVVYFADLVYGPFIYLEQHRWSNIHSTLNFYTRPARKANLYFVRIFLFTRMHIANIFVVCGVHAPAHQFLHRHTHPLAKNWKKKYVKKGEMDIRRAGARLHLKSDLRTHARARMHICEKFAENKCIITYEKLTVLFNIYTL